MLGEEELGAIPEELRPKVADLQRRVEDLESVRAHESAEREQRVFELQSRNDELSARLLTLARSKEQADKALLQAEANASTRLTLANDSTQKLELAVAEADNSKRQLRQVNEEKEALQRLLETRNTTIEELKEQATGLRSELDSVTAEKLKAIIAAEEEKALAARAAFQESRWVEERKALEEELRWVRASQTEAEERLSRTRTELRTRETDATAQITNLQEELSDANTYIQESKQREEELSDQLNDLNERLREAATAKQQTEDQFQAELEVQAKLCDVYKVSSTEAEAKVGELHEALESVTKVFEESKQNLLSMKEELERTRGQAEEDLKAAHEETMTVKEDLEKANELLRSKHRVMLTDEEVAALSPGAAAASKLIRDGRSLTNIYRDHSRVVEELQAAKFECRRLEQYIKEIVNDIQEKAPAIRKQKEEVQRVRDANKALQEQLVKAGGEQTAVSAKADSALRELKYTRAELQRYQRDNADLSAKVRHLLAYAERVRTGAGDTPVPMEEPGTEEEQLLFSSIEELETANARLTSALREAEARREELVRAGQEEALAGIRKDLDEAQAELTSLRKHRQAQETVIATLEDQREQMKTLYMQEREKNKSSPNNSSLAQPSPAICLTSPASNLPTASPGSESQSALARLETELSIVKKEKTEVDKINQAKIEQLSKQKEELSKTSAKLGADIIYAEERFKVLEKNTDSYKKEVERLRERLSKSESSCGKQEQRATDLTQRLLAMQEDLAKERVSARLSGEALETSRRREAELSARLDSLASSDTTQRNLAASVEELRHRLERNDAMRSFATEEGLEALRRDKASLQASLKAMEEEKRQLLLSYNHRVADLEATLDAERSKLQFTETRAAALTKEAKEAEEKAANLGVELEELRNSGKDASADRYQKENHQLQTRFNYLEVQFREKVMAMEKAQEELTRSKKEVERYENMSSRMEASIQREKDTATVVSEQLREEVASLRESRDAALVREGEAERALTALRQEKEDLETQLARLDSEAQRDKADLLASLASKEVETKEWREKEAEARADRDRFSASLQDLQASLDNSNAKLTELQTALDQSKATIAARETAAHELRISLEETKTELNQLQSQRAEADNAVSTQRSELEKRLAQVEQTNENLNQQIVQLGSVVSAYEKTTGAENPTPSGEGGELSGKSTGALMEAMRHLRDEKSRTEERESAATAEAAKLRDRQSQLEEQLTKTKAELSEARGLETQLAEAAAEKTKLVSQLESLKEISAANAVLRNSLTSLQNQLGVAQSAQSAAEAKTGEADAERRRLETEVTKLGREVDAAAADTATWRRRHEELVQQRSTLESAQVSELRKELRDKDTKLEELGRLRASLSAKEAEAESAQSAAAKERERLEQELADHASKAIDAAEKLTNMENDLNKERKTLQQARQLAIKYKNMYKEAEEKIKKGMPPVSAPASASTSHESVMSESRIAELEETKKTLEEKLKTQTEKLAAQTQQLSKGKDQQETEISELKQRLNLIQEQGNKTREGFRDVGQKLAEANREKSQLSTQLQEMKQELEKAKTAEWELKETKQRLAAIQAMQRRQQQQAAAARPDEPREEEDQSGPSAPTPAPVVQPVVPQPAHSSQTGPEETLPQPGRFPTLSRLRRGAPPVASVPPTGGRRQQALVPPSVSPSPSPALPDQSSSSTAPAPAQASVPPMQMAVSTTGPAPPQPPPVPQAVVSPHHNLPQQEQVSGSSDVVSAGPGTSSASSSFRNLPASPHGSTARKRPFPTNVAPSLFHASDKRTRSDSPEQVSTSEPVLPFSQSEGAASSGGGEVEYEGVLPGEGDEDVGEDAPLPTEGDSSDDEGVVEPEDMEAMEEADEDEAVEPEESEDEEPNDVVESTGSDLDHGGTDADEAEDDEDDDVQIIEEDFSFAEAMPAAESPVGMGDDGDGIGHEGGEELPSGDGIVPSAPGEFLDSTPNVGSSGTSRHVPESSGVGQMGVGMGVGMGSAASPPDEGIDSDSGGASSTVQAQPALPAAEEARHTPVLVDPTDKDDEPSTSNAAGASRKITLRKPIVWSLPGNEGPPDLATETPGTSTSTTAAPAPPPTASRGGTAIRSRGSARKSLPRGRAGPASFIRKNL